MPKFFVPRQNIADNKVIINNEDAAHIVKVLRAKIGDELTVCDGRGIDYTVKISVLDKKEIVCDVISQEKSDTESNIKITLFQGLPKASKMEYIIQKATELGVVRIVPCVMARCVVKLSDGTEKKLERWRRVAYEAAKQSGRGVVPEVTDPVEFDRALTMLKENDVYFAPYECEENTTLRSVLEKAEGAKTVGFMIGPEGGYDLSETDRLQKEHISTVTLGKRILRTETAGEAVAAMVMYEIGDINIIGKDCNG